MKFEIKNEQGETLAVIAPSEEGCLHRWSLYWPDGEPSCFGLDWDSSMVRDMFNNFLAPMLGIKEDVEEKE